MFLLIGADWTRRNEAAAAERCAGAREAAVAGVEAETDNLSLPDLASSLFSKVNDITAHHTAKFNTVTTAINDTAAGPCGYRLPCHRVPAKSRDEGSKCESTTWRAMSARPRHGMPFKLTVEG